MAISVQPVTIGDKKGWLVTKDGQQYTVTDTNDDGIFNKGDLIDCAEGATPLNAEDIFNVSYSVQLKENGGKGVSAETMAQYAEYQQAAQERDARQADYDLAQRKAKLAQLQAAKPKKKNWMDKVMPWLNLTQQAAITGGMVYGAIKGDFWGLGMLGGNWAYNSGSIADMAGLNYTGLANLTLLNSQLGSDNDLWSSMGLNFTGGAAGLAGTEKAALTTAQNKVDTIIGNAGKATSSVPELTDRQKEALLEKADQFIRETINKNAESIPAANKEQIRDIVNKDASELTDEDIKILNQIMKTPFIDYTLIDADGDGKKPLTLRIAQRANNQVSHVLTAEEKDLAETTKLKRDKYNEIVNNTKDWSIYTDESVKEFFTWIASNLENPDKDDTDIPELVKKS